MRDELPEGWTRAPIKDFASKVGSGATPRGGTEAYVSEGIPLIRSMNVRLNGFDEKGLAFLTQKQADALSEVTVQPKDVLLNITGASIGRVTTAPASMDGARVNQHVCLIRPVSGVEPEYIGYYLASPGIQDRIHTEEYGVTRQALTKAWICDLEVPIAPLSEQRRIVARVEALLDQVNRVKARLARVQAILKRFRQAILAAACSGRLTEEWRKGVQGLASAHELISDLVPADRCEDDDSVIHLPDSWVWAPVEDLCDPNRTITYGVIKLGRPAEGGVPTLRSSDVRTLFIDRSGIKKISHEIARGYNRTFLRGGEVLVTVRGTLGGVAVVPSDMAGYNISREVAVLPLRSDVDPEYVAFAIASISSQKWLAERAKGVAYTGINLEDLRLLPIPLPPAPEQLEIVHLVRSCFATVQVAEQQLAVAASRAEGLSHALLSKAFSGDLVATEAELARAEGRDYQAADMLLVRIRKEREMASKQTARRKMAQRKGGV